MKYSDDWTEIEDKELKDFNECDWEESCVMCKNYEDCTASKLSNE